MLNKSLFSPAQPRCAKTHRSPGFVLASLKGSTYRIEPLGGRNYWRGFSVRQEPLQGRTAHTKCGTYLLASSLAAALLNGLFEHPAWHYPIALEVGAIEFSPWHKRFSADSSGRRSRHGG